MPLDPSAADLAGDPPPAPTPPPQKPRRRWLRFSLRSLLLVMLISGCGLGLVGREYQQGRDQRAAIEWVEQRGGKVEYRPGPPLWQQRLLGEWYPRPVRQIDLRRTSLSELTPLLPLTETEALLLNHPLNHLPELSPLAHLPNLQILILPDREELPSFDRLSEANPRLLVCGWSSYKRWDRPRVPGEPPPPMYAEAVADDAESTVEYSAEDASEDTAAGPFETDGHDLLVLPFDGSALYLGEEVIVPSGGSLTCFSAEQRQRWQVTLEIESSWLRAESRQLPGGDLVIYVYDAAGAHGGELVRLDPASGDVRWQARVTPGLSSLRTFEHEEGIEIQGETLAVLAAGVPYFRGELSDIHVELFDLQTGERLNQWEFTRP